jgi:hypothetical protein
MGKGGRGMRALPSAHCLIIYLNLIRPGIKGEIFEWGKIPLKKPL